MLVSLCLQAHMKFPPDYPYSPPSIRFMTKVWHPNVYEVSEYKRELSIPRTFSLSPFRPFPLVRVYVRVLPCLVPFLFIRPALTPLLPSHTLTHSLSLPFTAPRCITTVPLCPLVRPPLFIFHPSPPWLLQPSAFTSSLSALVKPPGPSKPRAVRRFHRDATGGRAGPGRDGRGEKKKVKTAPTRKIARYVVVLARGCIHIDVSPPTHSWNVRPYYIYRGHASSCTTLFVKTPSRSPPLGSFATSVDVRIRVRRLAGKLIRQMTWRVHAHAADNPRRFYDD